MSTIIRSEVFYEASNSDLNVETDVYQTAKLPYVKENLKISLPNGVFTKGVDDTRDTSNKSLEIAQTNSSQERLNLAEELGEQYSTNSSKVLDDILSKFTYRVVKQNINVVGTNSSPTSLAQPQDDKVVKSTVPVVNTSDILALSDEAEKIRSNLYINTQTINKMVKVEYPESNHNLNPCASSLTSHVDICDKPLFSDHQLNVNTIIASRMSNTSSVSVGASKTQEIINTYHFFEQTSTEYPPECDLPTSENIPRKIRRFFDNMRIVGHPDRDFAIGDILSRTDINRILPTNSQLRTEVTQCVGELSEFERICKNVWAIDPTQGDDINLFPNENAIDLCDSLVFNRPQYGNVLYSSRSDDFTNNSLLTYLANPLVNLILKDIQGTSLAMLDHGFSVSVLTNLLSNSGLDLTPLLFNLIAVSNSTNNAIKELPLCIDCNTILRKYQEGVNLFFLPLYNTTSTLDTVDYLANLEQPLLDSVHNYNCLYCHVDDIRELYLILALLIPGSIRSCLTNDHFSLKYYYDLSKVNVVVRCSPEIKLQYCKRTYITSSKSLINSAGQRFVIPQQYMTMSLELLDSVLSRNHHFLSSSDHLARAKSMYIEYNTIPYATNLPQLCFNGRRTLMYMFLNKSNSEHSVMEGEFTGCLSSTNLLGLSLNDIIQSYLLYDNVTDIINDQIYYEQEVLGIDSNRRLTLVDISNLKCIFGSYGLVSCDILEGRFNCWLDSRGYYRLLRRNVCNLLSQGLSKAAVSYTKGNWLRLNAFLSLKTGAKFPGLAIIQNGSDITEFKHLGTLSTQIAKYAEIYQFDSWNWRDNVCRGSLTMHLATNKIQDRVSYIPQLGGYPLCLVGNSAPVKFHRYTFTYDDVDDILMVWKCITPPADNISSYETITVRRLNPTFDGRIHFGNSHTSKSDKKSDSSGDEEEDANEHKEASAKTEYFSYPKYDYMRNLKSDEDYFSTAGGKKISFKLNGQKIANSEIDNLAEQLREVSLDNSLLSNDSSQLQMFENNNSVKKDSVNFDNIFKDYYTLSKGTWLPIVNKEDYIDAITRIPFNNYIKSSAVEKLENDVFIHLLMDKYTYTKLQTILRDEAVLPIYENCGFVALSNYLTNFKLSKRNDFVFKGSNNEVNDKAEIARNREMMASLVKISDRISREFENRKNVNSNKSDSNYLEVDLLDKWFTESCVPMIFINFSTSGEAFKMTLYNIPSCEEFVQVLSNNGCIVLIDSHYYLGRLTNLSWCVLHDVINVMSCENGKIQKNYLSNYKNIEVTKWIMWCILNQDYTVNESVVQLKSTRTDGEYNPWDNQVYKTTYDSIVHEFFSNSISVNLDEQKEKRQEDVKCMNSELFCSSKQKVYSSSAEYAISKTDTVVVDDILDYKSTKFSLNKWYKDNILEEFICQFNAKNNAEMLFKGIDIKNLNLRINTYALFACLDHILKQKVVSTGWDFHVKGGSLSKLRSGASLRESQSSVNTSTQSIINSPCTLSGEWALQIYLKLLSSLTSSEYLCPKLSGSSEGSKAFAKNDVFDLLYLSNRDSKEGNALDVLLEGIETVQASEILCQLQHNILDFRDLILKLAYQGVAPLSEAVVKLVLRPMFNGTYSLMDSISSMITLVIIFSAYSSYDTQFFTSVRSPNASPVDQNPSHTFASHTPIDIGFQSALSSSEVSLRNYNLVSLHKVFKAVWSEIILVLMLYVNNIDDMSEIDKDIYVKVIHKLEIQDLCLIKKADVNTRIHNVFNCLLLLNYIIMLESDSMLSDVRGIDLNTYAEDFSIEKDRTTSLFGKLDIFLRNNISLCDFSANCFKITRIIYVCMGSLYSNFTKGLTDGSKIFPEFMAPPEFQNVSTRTAMYIFRITTSLTLASKPNYLGYSDINTVRIRSSFVSQGVDVGEIRLNESPEYYEVAEDVDPGVSLSEVFKSGSMFVDKAKAPTASCYYGAYGTIVSGLDLHGVRPVASSLIKQGTQLQSRINYDTSMRLAPSCKTRRSTCYDSIVQIEKEVVKCALNNALEKEVPISRNENKNENNMQGVEKDNSGESKMPKASKKVGRKNKSRISLGKDSFIARSGRPAFPLIDINYTRNLVLGISRDNYIGCRFLTVLNLWYNYKFTPSHCYNIWTCISLSDRLWINSHAKWLLTYSVIPGYKNISGFDGALYQYKNIKSKEELNISNTKLETYSLNDILIGIVLQIENKRRFEVALIKKVDIKDKFLFNCICETAISEPSSPFAQPSSYLPNMCVLVSDYAAADNYVKSLVGISSGISVNSQNTVCLFGVNKNIESRLVPMWIRLYQGCYNKYRRDVSMEDIEEFSRSELVAYPFNYNNILSGPDNFLAKLSDIYMSLLVYSNADTVNWMWNTIRRFKREGIENSCWLHLVDLSRNNDVHLVSKSLMYNRSKRIGCNLISISYTNVSRTYKYVPASEIFHSHLYLSALSVFSNVSEFGLLSLCHTLSNVKFDLINALGTFRDTAGGDPVITINRSLASDSEVFNGISHYIDNLYCINSGLSVSMAASIPDLISSFAIIKKGSDKIKLDTIINSVKSLQYSYTTCKLLFDNISYVHVSGLFQMGVKIMHQYCSDNLSVKGVEFKKLFQYVCSDSGGFLDIVKKECTKNHELVEAITEGGIHTSLLDKTLRFIKMCSVWYTYFRNNTSNRLTDRSDWTVVAGVKTPEEKLKYYPSSHSSVSSYDSFENYSLVCDEGMGRKNNLIDSYRVSTRSNKYPHRLRKYHSYDKDKWKSSLHRSKRNSYSRIRGNRFSQRSTIYPCSDEASVYSVPNHSICESSSSNSDSLYSYIDRYETRYSSKLYPNDSLSNLDAEFTLSRDTREPAFPKCAYYPGAERSQQIRNSTYSGVSHSARYNDANLVTDDASPDFCVIQILEERD